MEAGTLNCPMCGAAAATNSVRCEHCGARLAVVACPSCFGMMFLGAAYCAHCGARAARAEAEDGSSALCPRCRVQLHKVLVGNAPLQECPQCAGLWVAAESFQQICNNQEEQAAVLGTASPLAETGAVPLEKAIRYLPCPICRQLMNRVNFAHCSHVVVDVCRTHGTWFDKDELRQIVEFIRGGGLETARAKELAELEERRRKLKAEQVVRAWDSGARSSEVSWEDWGSGIAGAASILRLFRR